MKVIGFIACIFWASSQSFAQTITYNAQDKPLTEILDEVSSEYAVFFSYSTSAISTETTSITANQLSIQDFLTQLLRPFQLGFEFVETTFIVIKPIAELGVSLELVVADSDTRQPLEYALIRQLNSYNGAYTNPEGAFTFFSKNPSSTTLEISYIGYTPREYSPAELYATSTDTIFLAPNTTELEGITVTEYVNSGITVENNSSTLALRPQSMEVLPGLTEPDALYSLQLLPGISSADESASDLSIRGGSSDQVSIYWDEIPIYHSGHYFGMISAFIPASVNKMNVYRSSVPTWYGGSASGLLEMTAPRFSPNSVQVDANSNLTHSSLTTFVPYKNMGLFIGGRRSINDYFNTTTFDSFNEKLFNSSEISREGDTINNDDISNTQELVFWDVNAKWLWKPDDSNSISISGFGSENKLNFRTINNNLNNADFQFHQVQTLGINSAWDRYWSPSFESKLSMSHSSYDLRYDFLNQRRIGQGGSNQKLLQPISSRDDHDDDDDDDPDEDEEGDDDDDPFEGGIDTAVDSLSDRGTWANQVLNTEVKIINTFTRGINRIIVGGQLNLLNVEYQLTEKNAFESDVLEKTTTKGNGYSLFGNYILGYQSNLTLNAGFRFTYFDFLSLSTFDPQVSATYRAANWLKFRTSLGRYHQYIRTLKNFENSISSSTEEIWFMADKTDFPLLRNDQLSAGFLIQRNNWLIDVEAYSKKLTGLISLNYNFGGLEDEESEGTDTIYGLDVLLRKRIKNYRTWISYSYIKAESNFPELEDSIFPSFLDRPHQLQWVNSLSAGAFEFSVGWSYKSGLVYTEPQSEEVTRVVEVDDDEIETEEYFVIDWGQTNSLRMPDYHRLDVSVWYTFRSKGTHPWTVDLGLSVLNVYDRRNFLNRLFYPDDVDSDEEIEIVEEERYLLGFTPNFSFRFRF